MANEAAATRICIGLDVRRKSNSAGAQRSRFHSDAVSQQKLRIAPPSHSLVPFLNDKARMCSVAVSFFALYLASGPFPPRYEVFAHERKLPAGICQPRAAEKSQPVLKPMDGVPLAHIATQCIPCDAYKAAFPQTRSKVLDEAVRLSTTVSSLPESKKKLIPHLEFQQFIKTYKMRSSHAAKE